ncbi:hypothetical protein [Anabaena sp. UHCC 0399]|nr:hypothetical protein [Anabaena sp. UHCC 0399]MEA5564736.1 hypothetical protein [Anabaena sp. UHCC 0399]
MVSDRRSVITYAGRNAIALWDLGVRSLHTQELIVAMYLEPALIL